jgi:hypothetical protein
MDITHTFDNGTLIEDEQIKDGATSQYNSNQSCIITKISSLTQSIIRQSRKYCVYQPGKSLLIKFTCILNARAGGNDKYTSSKVGYFDDSNGYFFEYSEHTLKIVYRTNVTGTVVNEVIPQSKWNLNTLTSLSNGYILNPSRVQIYFMDLQWLGVGRVRLGVVHNGHYLFCHEFLHDNILDKVYITNANLPMRHELGSIIPAPPNPLPPSSKAECKLICATVISEGGYDPVGTTYSASRDTTLKSVTSIECVLIAITLKPDRNRTTVIPTKISIFSLNDLPKIYYLRLFRAPINLLTGANWISVHNNSAVQYDISSMQFNTTDAITIEQGYFTNKIDIQLDQAQLSNFLFLASNIEGSTSDIFVVSTKCINQEDTSNTLGSIQWKEIF